MTELNALQWAGIVSGTVSVLLFMVAWLHPSGTEDREFFGAIAATHLISACVFAGLGLAKQTGVIQ